MTPLYWLFLIIGAPFAFAGCLFLFGRHVEREADGISRLEREPLPQTVVAFKRIDFLVTLALLCAAFAFCFAALTVAAFSVSPTVLVITIPLGAFALVVFAHSVIQLFRDTRLTPWGKPVISLSANGISVKGRWSVQWNQDDEINFVYAGGRYPVPFMLLNVQDARHFGKNSWPDTISLALAVRQSRIRQPFLSLELGSTSLPIWQYQILAKRYWCASRGAAYAPTLPGQLIDGSVLA